MSNTNNRNLDGMEYNSNVSIIKDCSGKGGSLEAEDTIFSDIFLSYTSNTPISLANSLFNQDGSVIITSTNPASNCSTSVASLIVNGGALINNDSVIKGILRICNTTNSYDNSTGSLIVSGGASIYKNLSLNGVLSIFNSTSSTASSGSIITLGGITIQNSTNSTNISNGGALTVAGGASFLGDIYSNNFYGNQIFITNGNFGFITSSNLLVSNGNFINISSNSLISTTISSNNLYSNNISSTNNSAINFISTYSTFSNVLVLNENITNLSVGNLYNTNGFINNLNSTLGNIETLTVGNLYVVNNIEYNDIVTNLSTANIISDFTSIGSLQLSIGTFGSLHGIIGSSFIYSDTISTGNLLSINIITTNTSTANLTVSNAKINLATISSLQVTNGVITNFTSSNSIITNGTVSTLFSSSGNIINLNSTKATIGALSITDSCPSISSTQAALVLWYGGLSINNTTDVTSLTSGGGLTIAGGASIIKSLLVGNTISSSVISSGSIYSNFDTTINLNSIYSTSGKLYLTSTTPSYSSTCGALVSAGGISIFNTTDVTSLTSGGGFTDAGGASIAKSLLVGGTIGATVISAGSAIINNLTSVNSTNENAVLTNTSISNLTVFSQTVNNLFVNNSTTANANFGNITSANLNSSSANISTLIFTNGSFGTLLGNYLSANYITNNISLRSQNATIQNLNSNNSSIQNIQITNGTFGGLIGNNLDSYTGSIGTLLSLNASIGNLYNTNNTTINQVSTNITTSSIIGTNANFIYATIGTLNAPNIITNSLTIGTLSVAQNSIGSLSLNYETVGNSYIINLTNGNASITNSTIQNITNVYISSSNGSFVNITSGTGTIINLFSTNGSFTNITSQNIYSNFIYTTDGNLINSTLNNTYITNSTIANIYNNYSTISNLYSSNGNITNITNVNLLSTNGTFTNLLATNITNTNLISTNETIGTLNASGATFGNINFTGTLYQNGLPYIASQWTSYGPNIAFTTGNVGINTTNPTSTLDIIGTGHFTQNVNIDGNISTSNIYASNISVGNINNAISISSQLLSSVNIFSTNSTTTNFISSNSTISNELINNSTISNLHLNFGTISNLYINGSGPSYNSTTAAFILTQGGISINCTVNSTGISSGGAATLAGGLSVLKDTYIGGDIHITGASYITGNTWLNSPLDLNQNVINNVTAPSLNLQVANKWYVDNRFTNFTVGNVNGNFTQGQVIVATTGGNITGFNNFTFDGITLTLNSTADATSLTNGGALQVYGGASIDLSLFVGGNTHILGYLDMNNQKIMSVAIPTTAYDAANKYYVDNRFSQFTIGNVSGNFTQGQVIVATTGGNITGFSDFLFDGTQLFIRSTSNALGLGSGGTLTINGGASILGNVYFGSAIDLNGNKITNVTAPSSNLDVVNLWYLNNKFTVGNVSGNFTQGQVIVATTGGNITGFSDFLFDGITLTLNNTTNATGINMGGVLDVYGGASFVGDVYFGSPIDLNQKVINNVTAPSLDLQVANKWYVDNRFNQFTIGNVSGNFTQGQVIVATTGGNITGFSDFLFDGTMLTLSSTTNALGLGSGGTLRINGGASILGNVYIGSGLDLNNQLITNVTAPSLNLQVANKWYVDHAISAANTINGNFSSGQIIIAGSTYGTLLGYNNFLFDGTLFTLNSTTNAIGLGSGGSFNLSGGASILGNVYFGNSIDLNNSNITNLALPINPLDGVNKEYVDYVTGFNSGDIFEHSFTLLANTTISQNVTGFYFSNTLVSSFVGVIYLQIPEIPLYGQWEIKGLQKANGHWVINTEYIGDAQYGINFSITDTGIGGQIQYTNTNTVNATIRFKARTTSQGTFNNITLGNVSSMNVSSGGTGQQYFTAGCLLIGNDYSALLTNTNLKFTAGTLFIGNAASNIIGLNANGTKLTNVTAPSSNLDVANKWYVDNAFAGFLNNTYTNLIATNETVGTLNIGNLTTGNINFTGTLYQNGIPYLGSQWTGSVGSTISYTSGNVLVGTTLTSTNTTTQNLVATNSTIVNLILNNTTTGNQLVTNGTINNLSTLNIFAVRITTSNLLSTNNTFTNLNLTSLTTNNEIVTNSTISNLNNVNIINTNLTNTNLLGSSATFTNINFTNITGSSVITTFLSSVNFITTNANITNSTILNLANTNAVISSLTASNTIVTNSTITNFNNFNMFSSFLTVINQSVSNLLAVNASIGSLTVGNIYSTNTSLANLNSINGGFTNLTTTSLLTTNGSFINSTFTNLLATNATINTLINTNSILTNTSISNAFITNANITTLTLANLVVTNETFSNLIGTNSIITNLTVGNEVLLNETVGSLLATNINTTTLTSGNAVITNNITSKNILITGTTNANNILTIDCFNSQTFGGQILFKNSANTGDFRIFGDGGDVQWLGGGGRAQQFGSYHQVIITGGRASTLTIPQVGGNNSTYNCQIINTNNSIGLQIKGVAAQTVDLLQIINSANTVLTKVDFLGRIGINSTTLATGQTTTGSLYTLGGATINQNLYVNSTNLTPNTADIFSDQTFVCANAQLIPANITGFSFNNLTVRYFQAMCSSHINTTSGNISNGFEIKGIQTGTSGSWLLNTTFIGASPPKINFSITTTGQLLYTSSSVGAFVSSTLHFRALTLSV
jgi:hypothetical protein